MTTRFDYLTKTATKTARNWSNRDTVVFHCFNPNGLCAAKRAVDDEISAAVAAGRCKSGAILAYGSFASHSYDLMMALLKTRRVNPIKLSVATKILTSDIETARNYVSNLPA